MKLPAWPLPYPSFQTRETSTLSGRVMITFDCTILNLDRYEFDIVAVGFILVTLTLVVAYANI